MEKNGWYILLKIGSVGNVPTQHCRFFQKITSTTEGTVSAFGGAAKLIFDVADGSLGSFNYVSEKSYIRKEIFMVLAE